MKYRVNAICTISLSTIVEASSPEEAEEIAKTRTVETLPSRTKFDDTIDAHFCHSGELDGEPQITYTELLENT